MPYCTRYSRKGTKNRERGENPALNNVISFLRNVNPTAPVRFNVHISNNFKSCRQKERKAL